jgi:hypothetical protein
MLPVDVLEEIAQKLAISIVTTLPATHALRAEFASVSELYHAGHAFERFRLQALISGVIAARGTRAVLSNNSIFDLPQH